MGELIKLLYIVVVYIVNIEFNRDVVSKLWIKNYHPKTIFVDIKINHNLLAIYCITNIASFCVMCWHKQMWMPSKFLIVPPCTKWTICYSWYSRLTPLNPYIHSSHSLYNRTDGSSNANKVLVIFNSHLLVI